MVSASISKTCLRNVYRISHFLFATFILSTQCTINFPQGAALPGYNFLWSLTPSQYLGAPGQSNPFFDRFWPAVSAVYLVWTLDRSLLLQKIFTTRLVQYLGRISFSMYLVHFQLWMAVAEPILIQTYQLTDTETILQYFSGFAMGYVVYLVLVIWVADLFTRVVDEKCVKLSKWGYEKLTCTRG